MRRTVGWLTLLSIGGLSLSAAGCANFIDQITSRDFRVKNLFVKPEPMSVLRESTDGDARANAMRSLKEPTFGGGSPLQQEEVIQILTQSAVTDPRPLCRLAAIEALGRFEDARTAPVLLQAYQKASDFPTEVANTIRCEAMTAMAHKNNSEVLALLAQVASNPQPRKPKPAAGTRLVNFEDEKDLAQLLGQYDPDSQAARDSRLAAVRALGASKNQGAIDTLIPLLKEKDVALRDRAHEALQNITGRRDVAKDAEAWRSVVNELTPERVHAGIQ